MSISTREIHYRPLLKFEDIGENLLAGEVDIGMVLMEGEGVGILGEGVAILMDTKTEIPNLDEIIIPEDLNLENTRD